MSLSTDALKNRNIPKISAFVFKVVILFYEIQSICQAYMILMI